METPGQSATTEPPKAESVEEDVSPPRPLRVSIHEPREATSGRPPTSPIVLSPAAATTTAASPIRSDSSSPNGSTKSSVSSATSFESTTTAPALERAVSDVHPSPEESAERRGRAAGGATAGPSEPRSTPVLERSHTSSELLSARAREFYSARGVDKPFSTSMLSSSFEMQSVTLPPSGITEIELEKTTHTVFAVHVRLHGGLEWTTQKRYSDFRELHDKLKRMNATVKQLHFPKRHVFRNRHQSVIEQRRSELEKYINELVEIRPQIRVPLFTFLEVYSHMETYESKMKRQKKEEEWERMKSMLAPHDLEDYSAAFKRLCSSKYLYHGSSNNMTPEPDSNTTSGISNSNTTGNNGTGAASSSGAPTSPSKQSTSPTKTASTSPTKAMAEKSPPASKSTTEDAKEPPQPSQICISRASFRRDILGVFPDMPSSFAMRFMKAVTDRQGSDVNMDEFLRAVAILQCGAIEDKLKFVFNMCDLDHAGKVQSTGLSNFLVSLHSRHVQDRLEYLRLMNDGFEHGRARLTMNEFVDMVQRLDVSSFVTDWMQPFVEILCETADPHLLESQEEFNPVVQQKILASETNFSVKEVSILQDAFNNYRASGGGDVVDMDALASDFPLEMSDERFARVFSSFGARANGTDIDVFSFVSALAIACRGKPEEKAHCAFTLFRSKNAVMSRDDLYGMLRLDLAQNPKLENKVAQFLDKRKGKKPSADVIKSPTKQPTVSGSELGIFVDHVMEEFGHCESMRDSSTDGTVDVTALSLEEFTAWAVREEYEMAALRIMREVVFIDLGLIPENKEEELMVARECFKPFEPSVLIEDDSWFLIEKKWFEHWCRYINLPYNDITLPAASGGSSSLVEFSKLANGALHGARGAAANSKEPPQIDADGNYIRPKCINNYLLLTGDRQKRVLRSAEEIKQGKHFIVICEQLWMALKLWYGGGPEIRRKVIMKNNGSVILDIWETEAKKKKSGEDDEEEVPTDDEKSDRQIATLPRRMRSGGSVGLTNLGNTCYMNSALQCLTNTQLLAEYFLSGMYLDDVNRTSTMGLQGKLAEVYGKLAEDMWCAKQKALSPRNFKKTIGKFNEAFRGSDQQDAQELLAFLLSGLSEDLNRIQDKPYVEQPDSDGRYDSDLADEWWRNHLRREVSIIVALFTGQYKSLLTCSVCGFKSARFEPFTFLQVPLPEPTHNTVTVLLVLSNGTLPSKVSVRLGMAASVFDLKHELMKLCHEDFNLPQITEADIKICEYSGSMIMSSKADSRRIGQIRSIDRLIAFQLEPLDAEIIQATRQRRPSYTHGAGHRTDDAEADAANHAEFYESLKVGSLVEVKPRTQSTEYLPGVIVKFLRANDAHNHVSVRLRGDDHVQVPLSRVRPRQPRLFEVPLLFRKLSYSAVYFKNPFRPVPFGTPNLVRICPERTSGYDLYMLVWRRVRQYVPDATPPTPWEDDELTAMSRLMSNKIDGIFMDLKSPCGFLLRRVEGKGMTDSRSSWLTRSFGWTIPCTNEPLDILEEEAVAIDWDLSLFQDRGTLEKMKQVESHSSLEKNEAIDKGPVPLSHCLDAFTSEEKISEGYCSSCCKHQEMTKKLEIWRLPPVMVVHMKRFQYSQTYRRKLGSLVEFPIEGLDLKSCVAPQDDTPEKYPMKTKQNDAGNDKENEQAPAASESTANGGSTSVGAAKPDKDATAKSDAGSLRSDSAVSSESSKALSSFKSPASNAPSSAADEDGNSRSVLTRARRGYTNTNLDQSRCLETKYDLYGVVNHQGALGGGHYTAYAKNFMDDQWYFYDDERVRVIEESKIVTPSAYLLFYLRSDMKGMPVKDMYPANNKGKITDEDIDRFVEDGDERRCTIM